VRVQSIQLRNFRRFSDLSITDLPETARLIVLAGPNGVGKSSFFDGLQTWYRLAAWNLAHASDVYAAKVGSTDTSEWFRRVTVTLHGGNQAQSRLKESSVYFRTAYRHEADFSIQQLSQPPRPNENGGPARRAVDEDRSVSENYQRLLWQTFSAVYDDVTPDQATKAEIRDRMTGRLRGALLRVLPDLTLTRVGALEAGHSFEFTKGIATGFPYVNLSAGEKAIFDLLLDAVVKADYYKDSIWCIDEPELHVGTKAQGRLLRELMSVLPEQSQLFLASHSLGLMSEAVKMARETPGEVIFLDFEGHDFDAPVTLQPVKPDRQFWKRMLAVALDDMATLVAPATVVMCEGSSDGFDARCYRTIFTSEFPDVDFISVGNSEDAQSDKIGLTSALQTLTQGTQVIRLRDRDLASDEEVERWRAAGTSVLTRRHIEAYLFDPEVLDAFCDSIGRGDAKQDVRDIYHSQMAALLGRGKDADDVKSASGPMYVEIRKALSLGQPGSTARSFAEDKLAPLVRADMAIYQELRRDIFET
jgi:predicted ATPase